MRVQLAVASALLLALGCAHTTQTGKNADVKDATAPQSEEAAVRGRKVTPKTPPGHPPLAASPSELMEPGSQKKISDALEKKGVVHEEVRGEQLSDALRKFQQSQGLAATGFADHETLLRLGVDPKEVDKSLGNFSGTAPGKAQADVSKPSDDAGKGGSGAASKGTSSHGTPPSDEAPKSDSGG